MGGIVVKNKVFIIEFNAHWGDPEAQSIVPGIKNDLFSLGKTISMGTLNKLKVKADNKIRVAVAGVSRGYPGDYSSVTGKQIFGLEEAGKVPGLKIYGAGVKKVGGRYVAFGGRLFYLVGEGKNVIEAREKVYRAISFVSVEGDNLHFRTDIGWRDVERINGRELAQN